ncbi:MAG: hypothetical protein ABSB68_05025 [Acidimicrobiales bacterium]
MVARTAGFLDGRLSRRSLINRSAFVGSAVVIGAGLDLALRPGTAYGVICECGNTGCGCGSTCCSGFSEFCCSVSGANYCPENTVMGGWWMADNSSYCGGPRYYMDCNSTCTCDTGCSGGFAFCEPGCDHTGCGCGPQGCDSYLTGCLQFRYGQCNQDVPCMGRIVCRVVACVPPWQVDPSCTTAVAVDNATAEQNEPCWTPAPPAPLCGSPATDCKVVGLAASPAGSGYAVLTSFGRLFPYGSFPSEGDASELQLDAPIVAVATCPTGGYFLVASDGGLFDYGGAPFLGSMGGQHLDAPIVGMAATPTGHGYWLVAADGGIFDYGDAPFLGSMGGQHLNAPIVGMAATPTGHGYWLVAADGGVFDYGDAPFLGSMGGQHLNAPIVGMAATPSGLGYWLVAADGGIFDYGDAGFDGSTGAIHLNLPVVGIAAFGDDAGYWLVARDGGIFAFGGAPFLGSPA